MIDRTYITDTIIEESSNVLYTIKELFADFYGQDKVDYHITITSELIGFEIEDVLREMPPREVPTDELVLSRLRTSRYCIAGEILVYYPSIRITNEQSLYHDIQDVYVKIAVNVGGTISGGFTVNRATYTPTDYNSRYQHSHCPAISTDNPSFFSHFCLGRGPIVNTIASITAQFDENLWKLFIVEMDECLKRESLEGGPYIRISDIGTNSSSFLLDDSAALDPLQSYAINIVNDSSLHIEEFLQYLFSNKLLKFTFSNGTYQYTETPEDLFRNIGSIYRDWLYNKDAIQFDIISHNESFVRTYRFTSQGIYCYYRTLYDHSNLPQNNDSEDIVITSAPICIFKEKPVYRKIVNDGSGQNSAADIENLIAIQIISIILTRILNYLNINYGKEI